MSAITLRLPDEKHLRLKNLAETRGKSISQILNEMTTLLLADFDAEARFQAHAEHGRNQSERGIELLKKAMGEQCERRPDNEHSNP